MQAQATSLILHKSATIWQWLATPWCSPSILSWSQTCSNNLKADITSTSPHTQTSPLQTAPKSICPSAGSSASQPSATQAERTTSQQWLTAVNTALTSKKSLQDWSSSTEVQSALLKQRTPNSFQTLVILDTTAEHKPTSTPMSTSHHHWCFLTTLPSTSTAHSATKSSPSAPMMKTTPSVGQLATSVPPTTAVSPISPHC